MVSELFDMVFICIRSDFGVLTDRRLTSVPNTIKVVKISFPQGLF